MKKNFIIIAIIIAVCFPNILAYAHGVTYTQEMVGEKTLRVKLYTTDPKESRKIVISSWVGYPNGAGKNLDIKYFLVAGNSGYDTKDFDMSSFLPPVRILLFDEQGYEKPLFQDIKGHYAEDYIHHLHDAGIINGKNEIIFDPNALITRAEFMVMMTKALKLSGSAENSLGYKDIDTHWAKNTMLLAVKKGLIKGYEDNNGLTLKPNNPITVGEACVILSRAYQLNTTINGIYEKLRQNQWYSNATKKIFDAGVLNIDDVIYNNFEENKNINRADCSILVSRAMTTK